MKSDAPALEEQFVKHLTAYDEALASGKQQTQITKLPDDRDARGQLEEAQHILDLLEEDRRTSSSPSTIIDDPVQVSDWFSFDPKTGTGRLGRFELRRELGRGGGGIVFQAFDPRLGRLVALKIPRMEHLIDREARRRFFREAQAAAGLDHPNIVPVYEAGEVGAVGYIASAYCEGPTLKQWLSDRQEPLTASNAVDVVVSLADAIEYTHRHGIVHRDLKPANVLLAGVRSQESGVRSQESEITDQVTITSLPNTEHQTPNTPRITDFGLAKLVATQGTATASGVIAGTPAYMAPEQASGRQTEIGPAADIYALGAILYELLTRRPPFQGATDLDTIRQLVEDEPMSPRKLRADVPRDLEIICLKCLHKKPESRYGSAQALAEDLRCFLRGEPIHARPVTWFERLVKWARRHPSIAALIAVCICAGLALLAGGIAYALQLQRHNEALAKSLQRETNLFHEADAERRQAKQAQKKTDFHRRQAEARELLARRRAYAGTIWRANGAFENKNPVFIRDALKEFWPTAPDRDLRGFEWHYLWRLGRRKFALRGHLESVSAIAFSPDGKRCASASQDDTVKTWDVNTGICLATFADYQEHVHFLAWSTDGRYLACATNHTKHATLLIRDTFTGKIYSRTQQKARIERLAFLPDQPRFITCERIIPMDHFRLVIRNWQTGESVELDRRTDFGYGNFVFSPNHRLMGMSWHPRGQPVRAQLWDLATLKKGKTLEGDLQGFYRTADGKLVAYLRTACTSKLLFTDVHTGARLKPIEHPDDDAIDAGWVMNAGQPFVTTVCLDSQTIRIWDFASKTLRRKWAISEFKIDGYWPSAAACTLAMTSLGRAIHLRYLKDEKEFDLLPGPTKGGEAWSVAFSPDGRLLAVGYDNEAGEESETLKLWSATTGKLIANLRGHRGTVMGLAFSPDGDTLATASYDKSVRLWDVKRRETMHTLTGHTGPVRCLDFSPDGRTLATASYDATINLWDVHAERQPTVLSGHTQKIYDLQFSQDGQFLASTGGDGSVRLWHPKKAKMIWRFALGYEGTSVAFHPNGKWLLAGQGDGPIHFLDLRTGKAVSSLPRHSNRVWSLTFSPDGRTLASGCQDGTVRLWQAATGAELMPLNTTDAKINALAFSPDRRTLAAASHDGNVILWRAQNVDAVHAPK